MPELVYPYIFERIAIPKPWAGKRLAQVFPRAAADFPPGTGESIEIADLREASPKVANGAARGWNLHDLLLQFRPEILGATANENDFPLALKFIDTAEPLSIQVHPRDSRDAAGHLLTRGKAEAWLILEADEGALVYQGLKRGLTRQDFERALKAGKPQDALNAIKVRREDWLFNPAGSIHALGAGLTLLEIQQNCGVTLRFFDWPELDRQARALQIQEAFAAADFKAAAPKVRHAPPGTGVQTLEKPRSHVPFGVHSLRAGTPSHFVKGWPGFTTFTCLEGACELIIHGNGEIHVNELRPADTLLVPAIYDDFEIHPRGNVWLIESYAV